SEHIRHGNHAHDPAARVYHGRTTDRVLEQHVDQLTSGHLGYDGDHVDAHHVADQREVSRRTMTAGVEIHHILHCISRVARDGAYLWNRRYCYSPFPRVGRFPTPASEMLREVRSTVRQGWRVQGADMRSRVRVEFAAHKSGTWGSRG